MRFEQLIVTLTVLVTLVVCTHQAIVQYKKNNYALGSGLLLLSAVVGGIAAVRSFSQHYDRTYIGGIGFMVALQWIILIMFGGLAEESRRSANIQPPPKDTQT